MLIGRGLKIAKQSSSLFFLHRKGANRSVLTQLVAILLFNIKDICFVTHLRPIDSLKFVIEKVAVRSRF